MATRLYFHVTTDSTSGLPTSEQSSQTANHSFEAGSVNHVMNTTIGAGTSVQIGADIDDTEIGGEATDGYLYYTKFVSPPLLMSSISANTWTYNIAHTDNNETGRIFPIVGGATNRPIHVNCYVWRPGTSSLVGTILDGDTASTLDNNNSESTAFVHHTTFSGSAVSSMQDNDVLIFEVWSRVTYTSGINRQCFFSYDGGTENTTDNANAGAFNNNNHASFIETPETLVFVGPPAAAPEPNKTSHTNIGNARGILELSGRRPIIFIGARMEDLIENFTRIMIRKWVHYLNPILARFRDKSFISPVDSIQLTQS